MLKGLQVGLILAGLSLGCAIATAPAARAQDYPERPVAVVVPFSPGGSNDVIARSMAEGLTKLWGKRFVVENRAGAGTAIGSGHVARSKPDGHTILFVSSSYIVNAATQTKLPFDPVNSLRAVTIVATGDIAAISGPQTGIKSLDDLVRVSKSRPLLYATAGVGSNQHFYGVLLAEALGIEMTPIPYRGGAEGLIDLLGGRNDLVVGIVSGLLGSVQKGAHPLVVMGRERIKSLPNVPTVVERGIPQAITESVWFVFVPDNTPRKIMEQLHEGVRSVFATPEASQLLERLDAKPGTMSIEDSQAYVAREIKHWTALARKMGIDATK